MDPEFSRGPSQTASPQERAPDDVLRQSADPDLRRLCKKMFMVIKMVHHLQNVAPKPGKGEPKMISRMVDIVATMIKPVWAPQVQVHRGPEEDEETQVPRILTD